MISLLDNLIAERILAYFQTQFIVLFTSAIIFASSSAVNLIGAKLAAYILPSSSFPSGWESLGKKFRTEMFRFSLSSHCDSAAIVSNMLEKLPYS
jgi:hypothetical protein